MYYFNLSNFCALLIAIIVQAIIIQNKLYSQNQGQSLQRVSPYPFGGIGMKFACDLNNFHNPDLNGLTYGRFSTAGLGVFYKYYYTNGMLEFGINGIYKGKRNEFSFPLITKDVSDEDNIALSAFELDFKVGPRLWYLYPKFGMLLGYRTRTENFFRPGNPLPTQNQIHAIYAAIPMGIALELPTGFGSTGAGIYYEVGITDIIKDPDNTLPAAGRLRSWNFEIHVCFRTNK